MPRKPTDPLLPPLTPDELERRDEQEQILDNRLHACSLADTFDVERAYQAMRTYAIEIFRVIYPAYKRKPGYQGDWLPYIIDEAVHRVLVKSEPHLRYEPLDFQKLAKLLERTLVQHHRGAILTPPSDEYRQWESFPPELSRLPPGPPPPPDVQKQMEGT